MLQCLLRCEWYLPRSRCDSLSKLVPFNFVSIDFTVTKPDINSFFKSFIISKQYSIFKAFKRTFLRPIDGTLLQPNAKRNTRANRHSKSVAIERPNFGSVIQSFTTAHESPYDHAINCTDSQL